MKTKKASLYFLPLIVFISLIVLTNLYIVLLSKDAPFKSNPIGKRQFDLLKTYIKAESSLFYIDQSAKYALQQAVYDLAQNGGISETDIGEESGLEIESTTNTACGKFYGYSIWYEVKKDKSEYAASPCFEENNVNIHLQAFFNKNLNSYLLNYPHNILIDNYDYEVKGSLEIIGRAISPLKFDIVKDKLKQIAIKPIETQQGLVDFTGTILCAKGSRCSLRKDAYELLLKAQEIASKRGLNLEVYSAYRDLQKQIDIWEGRTSERYAQRYPSEKDRRKWVCYPYGSDAGQRCPHLTGNVVDVRLKEKTDFPNKNLHKIMTDAGWVMYEKEPWHFECCGTIRYAKAKVQGVTEIA